VCKLIARRLGFTYLDTGAMYRAVAWAALEVNGSSVEEVLQSHGPNHLPLTFAIVDGALQITYRNQLLNEELRYPAVTELASRISQYQLVRDYLNSHQRRMAQQANVVAEGRDTTSVVFPDATMRLFLTASLRARAERRFLEYQSKGIPMDYQLLQAQIEARDEADSGRAIAPLRALPGVRVVDTSNMDLEEVTTHLLEIIAEANTGESLERPGDS
jgi:CMP/dCMP kinase